MLTLWQTIEKKKVLMNKLQVQNKPQWKLIHNSSLLTYGIIAERKKKKVDDRNKHTLHVSKVSYIEGKESSLKPSVTNHSFLSLI